MMTSWFGLIYSHVFYYNGSRLQNMEDFTPTYNNIRFEGQSKLVLMKTRQIVLSIPCLIFISFLYKHVHHLPMGTQPHCLQQSSSDMLTAAGLWLGGHLKLWGGTGGRGEQTSWQSSSPFSQKQRCSQPVSVIGTSLQFGTLANR